VSCPKCQKGYRKVEGNRLICSCGYVEEVKTVVDNADLVETSEQDIWGIVERMRKSGVRYETIHFILQETIKTLEMQAYCEGWAEQNMPHHPK